MTLVEDIAIGGLCLAAVAFAHLLHAGLKTTKQRAEHYRQLPEEYPGLIFDVYLALVWSGILMVQLSNILHQAESGGSFRVTPLMGIGTAAVVFICGAYAGRLMMRLEMRRYNSKRDEQAREART